MTGTPRFASVAAQEGVELSRKDDLISLGYTLVYLLKGSLPWMEYQSETPKDIFDEILDIKSSIKSEKLCDGLPTPFLLYFKYLEDLAFIATPNYHMLKLIFSQLLAQGDERMDYNYDWIKFEYGSRRLPSSFSCILESLIYNPAQKSSDFEEVLISEPEDIHYYNQIAGIKTKSLRFDYHDKPLPILGQENIQITRNHFEPKSALHRRSNSLTKTPDDTDSQTELDLSEEEPRIIEKLNSMEVYQKAVHTFQEVKKRFISMGIPGEYSP